MPRLLLSVVFFALAWVSACGLSPRERAVSEANQAIRSVEEAGQVVAEAINRLPETGIERDAFDELNAALRTYMERAEVLNASLRGMVEFFPSLRAHLDTTYRPAAETALQACQEALDTFRADVAHEEDYRRAITRIGLCLGRFATAVTNVSAEYSRLPN
jgi:hypothetical protein